MTCTTSTNHDGSFATSATTSNQPMRPRFNTLELDLSCTKNKFPITDRRKQFQQLIRQKNPNSAPATPTELTAQTARNGDLYGFLSGSFANTANTQPLSSLTNNNHLHVNGTRHRSETNVTLLTATPTTVSHPPKQQTTKTTTTTTGDTIHWRHRVVASL